jgi:predicted ATPase/DNA-binding CsgD family transcriptional regulator
MPQSGQEKLMPLSAHNLPVQLTPFVGRTRELAEIIDLLANPDCRLLTLVGPGGIGKTRLAVEIGAHLLSRSGFDGVYLVALHSVSSPQCILSTVAEAIGARFYPGAEPQQQLVEYLRTKRALLIFDNFEHLVDGAEFVSDLLATASEVKVLATSRETLNLQEEWVYQVKGMHYPTYGACESGEGMENYSAARLFIQCAQRARSDFSPQSEERAIMRLCRLVEGMPLAIEITAAWLRRLPLQEIVNQLEGGLDILETSARNVPARHRSIRAVFDHSWDLLTDEERSVFKRLSVFRSGFRRDAAETVAGATLGILSTLVDKSLVHIDDSGRYDLHELLRQYAEERLSEQPDDAQQVHESHCDFYLNYVGDRSVSVVIHTSPAALADIEVEFDNILAACDWVFSSRDHLEMRAREAAMTFEWTLPVLRARFEWRCLFHEGELFFARVVAALRYLPPGRPLMTALTNQGLLIFLGSQDSAKAGPLIEEALSLAIRLQLRGWISDCYLRLSEMHVRQGDYDQACQLALEARNDSRQGAVGWRMTFPLAHLGYIAYLKGDFREAERWLREAIESARQHDVPIGVADAHNYLGQVQLAEAAYSDAWRTYSESLREAQRLDYLKGVVLALVGLGHAACGLRDFEQSRHYYAEALETALASHQIPFALEALVGVAELLAHTGDPDGALRLLRYAAAHPAANHGIKTHAESLVKSRFSPHTLDEDQPPPGSLDDVVRMLLDTGLSNRLQLPAPRLPPSEVLSERELEILGLMAHGLSNREIAEQLFLAVSTVKWHLGEIYSKIHVSSRTQALVRARELKLIA